MFEAPILRAWSPSSTSKDVHEDAGATGYALTHARFHGRALMPSQPVGLPLVCRLKDYGEQFGAEVEFWASLLATLAGTLGRDFDVVTAPPSSKKAGREWHLATELARLVAVSIGVEYASLLANDAPRGHRASYQEKLREGKKFRYLGDPSERNVLVVDDMATTGRTMDGCLAAARGEHLSFVVLSRH